MLADKHDEMICDLMETYGIIDYHMIPIDRLAVLVWGLGDKSRIYDDNVGDETILLANIADGVSLLIWGLLGDKNTKKPKSITDAILKKVAPQSGFSNPQELEAEIKRRQQNGSKRS